MKKPPRALKHLPPGTKPHLEKKDEKDPLYKVRGLSDPFFFCFNITPNDKIMIAHGVCFVSLVLHTDHEMNLLTEDRDPRVLQLIKYIQSNFIEDHEPESAK